MKDLFEKLKSPKVIALLVLIAVGYQFMQMSHNADLLKNAKYVGDASGPAPKDLIGTVAANAPDAPGKQAAANAAAESAAALTPQPSEPQTYVDPYLPTKPAFQEAGATPITSAEGGTSTPAPTSTPQASAGATLPLDIQMLAQRNQVEHDPAVATVAALPPYGSRHLYIKTDAGLMRFQIATDWTLTNAEWSKLLRTLSIDENSNIKALLEPHTTSLFQYRENVGEDALLDRSFNATEDWRLEALSSDCTPQSLNVLKFSRTEERGKCYIGKLVSVYRYKSQTRVTARPKFFSTLDPQISSNLKAKVAAHANRSNRAPASGPEIEEPTHKLEWYDRHRAWK